MARDYHTEVTNRRRFDSVDNQQGYAYVVLAREYEKHCSYGWFAALRNVGAAPARDQWISEGMALWVMLGGDDTHDDVNRIVKVMSQSLYDANKHRLRHVGPNGAQRVHVMDIPTDPGLMPREGDTLLPEPNPHAEALVRRLSEWLCDPGSRYPSGQPLTLTDQQRLVFNTMWETGSGSPAVLQRVTGLNYASVQGAVQAIRRKAEHFLDFWEYPPNIEGLNSKRTAGAQ